MPMLVMERLETSLDHLLEYVPNLPLTVKRSILEDVASALLYLHKRIPPVIHRYLTSKNVLLTSSLVAKIASFGSSCTLRPDQIRRMSPLPGTIAYMAPEAIFEHDHSCAHYGLPLDIFSFGHLALFTITQVY